MQVSEWTYCSHKSSPPLLSCSRYGFVASASFNLLTIYKNTATGLKPISSSKAFEKPITTISWCNFYDSESELPLYLLIGFENGSGVLFDIQKFMITSTFSFSESAISSSEWSNLHSNYFFVGYQNGDLISAYFVKSTENDTDISIIVSWKNSCAFPVEQLHTNHNDCQMIMVASNQGKFAIYDQIYDCSPMRLFTGSFEEDEELPNNLTNAPNSITSSNNNLNSSLNNPNTASLSSIFDNINPKCFVQCGFHPHVNDIFYFATQSRIFYGFIKEQTTVSLFPTSSFIRLVGVFFPPSDENAIIVIQRPSILLLSYSIDKGWKRLCEIPNFNSCAVSFADCKFEKNSFIVASRGNNLSIIKFYRRKLFHVGFMRNLVSKPSKIAVNNSFYAFIVKNPKTHSVGPNKNNYFLYLAPQLTCMTSLCLVYNIDLNSNYDRNYFSKNKSNSAGHLTNEIMYITQIEWISDTDLIFAARCQDNKHKLFFFNYQTRELISILKPQLEFMFLDKQFDSRSSVTKSLSKTNSNENQNSDNSNINLLESIMEEVGINPNSSNSSNNMSSSNLSQSILVSSTYNFSPSTFLNPSFYSYYSTLVNNDLSIRLHIHRNQKYFAATIGNFALEFFIISQSKTPQPLLFENSSVLILPEPAAVSFIDDSNEIDKLAIFYKDHIDICCITTSTNPPLSPRSSSSKSSNTLNAMSFELINKYEYHNELKSVPMLAHSFSETFHIIILESGEIETIKIKNDTHKKTSIRDLRKVSTDSFDNDNYNNSRKLSVDSYNDNENSLSTEPSESKDESEEKLSAFSEVLGKMSKISCLRVASDASTCMVIGKQPRAENVAFITLSKSGKSKLSFPKEKIRLKRCDYVSNSIIFANVFGSRCFTFCSIIDRKAIDTPHHEIRIPSISFENLKMQIINELMDRNGIKNAASTSYLAFDSQYILLHNTNYIIDNDDNNNLSLEDSSSSFSSSFGSTTTSAFTTNEEIDFSSSSDVIEPIEQDESDDENIKKKQPKKPNKNEEEENYDESEYEDENEDEIQKETKDEKKNKKETEEDKKTIKMQKKASANLKSKSDKITSIAPDFDSNSTMPSSSAPPTNPNTPLKAALNDQLTLSSSPKKKSAKIDQQSVSSSSSIIPLPKDSLVDVSFVSHLADKMYLFYISDLLQSVGQKYDPLCYGINLNENYLVYYLRSLSEMLGENQPQPLNRRQAVYQKLANDLDGTLSRLLTVGQTEGSNHTKNMLKLALSTLQLNEESFQMMLDVLLESGLDEDATDILFFSGKYNYRSVERFVTSGELEFAVIATRLLLQPKENDPDEVKDRKQKEMEKAISIIVNFYNGHNRKHQIVPFLLGMRKFDEAAKYLDDYGEHKCASVIKSLVVSDGKILLDYSKLPSI